MTNAEAKNAINAAIANCADADRKAKLEVAREYFFNPEFRKALSDATWAATQA